MQANKAVLRLLRIIVIGVALCATPIFNSVYAQTYGKQSNQASLLLEIQTLRQEIAELRDMVERQQFQMRKLQRQMASQPTEIRSPIAESTVRPNYSRPSSSVRSSSSI